MTSYCKKCKADVPPADVCPICGGRLTNANLRVAWCTRHRPVADWMCWNAVARLLLPGIAACFGLVLLCDLLAGGPEAVASLLLSGLGVTFLVLTVACMALTGLILCLQGEDMTDCVIDSRGIHIQQFLIDPTPLKLLARGVSPQRMREVDPEADIPMAALRETTMAWRDIARVQLWPEKTLILIYAPYFWMRVCLYATPSVWYDALAFMRDKVGRKKNLLLPPELVAPPKEKK